MHANVGFVSFPRYFAFDFHKECRGMKFENTLLLLDKLKEYIDKFNVYFWVEQSGNGDKVFCKQETVFRTNCMDCLDRTNVVQSSIARYILAAQMIRFGVNIEVDGGDEREEDIEFNNVFNHSKSQPWNFLLYHRQLLWVKIISFIVWANNGDSISFAYTGTDALKGDFTR